MPLLRLIILKTNTMKSILTILAVLCIGNNVFAQVAPVDEQIKLAVLAAPADYRADASVIGFDDNGNVYSIKEGTNEFICVANNPSSARFQISCYHKSLEPFMARGRALREEGKNPQEIFDIREDEAKAGTLEMPTAPAAMHIYYGDDVSLNEEDGELQGGKYRYVVYIPFATQESTGLSLRPNGQGHPWLMNPGTHRAHIMISPPE